MIDWHWEKDKLSPNQYKIADYIQKNTQLVLFSTEQEIADALGLSIASVSRFWRSVGYANIKDFKAQVRQRLEVTPAAKMKQIIAKTDGANPPGEFLESAVAHLQETVQHFSQQTFDEAVSALLAASRIFIYAPGPSAGLGELLQYRLQRLGLPIRRIERGGSELFEDLVHLTSRDIVVLFGFTRLLPESRVMMAHARETGYRTLLITDRLVSDFTVEADLMLFASRGEMWEFHSMVAPTFLIENLIIAVGRAKGEESLGKLEEISRLRRQYADDLPR